MGEMASVSEEAYCIALQSENIILKFRLNVSCDNKISIYLHSLTLILPNKPVPKVFYIASSKKIEKIIGRMGGIRRHVLLLRIMLKSLQQLLSSDSCSAALFST